jgi:hypothetical protein
MNSAISITNGYRKSVKVPFLSEGYIQQLIVKQTGGTATAYTVDLYMSSLPFPAGETTIATAGTGTVELYRIIPTQTILSGAVLDLSPDYEVGWPFRNVDGDHTNNQRYIYLVIRPSASADTTKWDAFIMGYSNHLPV